MSGNDYNPSVESKFNFNSNELQEAYRISQNTIWQNAKHHLEKIGFKTTIPSIRGGKGCYIQYPKSQGYLRKTDLIKLHPYLSDKLKNIDVSELDLKTFISLTDLDKIYLISYEYKSRNFTEKYNSKGISKNLILNQIYSFYLEEEYSTANYSNSIKSKLYYCENDGIFILKEKKEYYLDFTKPLINQFSEHDLRIKDIYILELDYQWGDYQEVLNVNRDKEYFFLIRKNTFLHQRLIAINYENINYDDFVLIKVHIDETNEHLFSDYISNIRPNLELLRGIKVSRSAFMFKYGPVYTVHDSCIVTIDNKSYKTKGILDLSELKPGLHALKISGSGRKTIEIVNVPLTNKINHLSTGLNLKTYSIGGTDIIGQNLNFVNSSITPRDFIQTNLSRNQYRFPRRIKSNNLVLDNFRK